MRINKYIAHAGYCSRRKADDLVKKGKVRVNGKIERDLSRQVDEGDEVKIADISLDLKREKYYLAFNKPLDVVCSNKDKFNKRTIFDYIDIEEKLFSIGRLDKNSEGLILITNDGDLYNRVMHPSANIDKYYRVKVKPLVGEKDVERLESGVDIGGYITKSCRCKLIKNSKDYSYLDVVIHEGKNRQIRRMFKALGYEVASLKRYRIGNVRIGELKVGKYRHLNKIEVEQLKNS